MSFCVCVVRFFMMGGECNYLLYFDHERQQLAFCDDHLWKSNIMMNWEQDQIEDLLDEAEDLLVDTAARLRLSVQVGVLAY